VRDFKVEEIEYMNGNFKYHIYSGNKAMSAWTLIDNSCISLEEAMSRIEKMKGQIVKDRRVVYSD
jgi:hypothetical protein